MNYFLLKKSPTNLIESAQTLKRTMGINEWLLAWCMVKRMKMGTMEVIHQIIPHIACLFNRKSQTVLEFGYACIKETVPSPGTSIIERLLDYMWFQIEDSFDRSTTASDCCDANQGRFDDRAQTMDESDAFECEVDNVNEALASKLAVISLMECEARIDNWSDRELMSRLALVLSLEKDKDEVLEGSDDGGGVNSKLAVISLPFIKVDANVDMEVFVTLEVFARLNVAMVAAGTLRAALILFFLLRIFMPSR
jgi:hypothetical protein